MLLTSIARCENCDQNWHLHCTDPPLSRALKAKLICPNNSEHILRKLRRPKGGRLVGQTPKKEVKPEVEVEAEIVVTSDEEQTEPSIQKALVNNFQDTATGINAPILHDRYKQMERDGAVYRLHSKGVKLDFIQAVYEMRGDQYYDTRESEILLALDEIATRDSYERGQRLEEINNKQSLEILVESALSLSRVNEEVIDLHSKKNARILSSTPPRRTSQAANHKVPLTLHLNLRRGGIATVSSSERSSSAPIDTAEKPNSQHSSPYDSTSREDQEEINPDERSHLLAIKRLLELKGKDAFMEFLLPKEDGK